MPKLPTFEQLGGPSPQAPGGIASYRATSGAEAAPDAALAQVGNQLETGSDRLFALIKQEQEKVDTTRVEDAWNQYKNHALDMTVGEKGLLNRKGGDAVNGNLLQTAGKSLEEQRKAIEGGLANDEQRRRFTERAQNTDLQVKHQILNHLVTEQREYAKVVMGGSESTARAAVAALPTDPDVMVQTRNIGEFTRIRDSLLMQADAFLKGQGIDDKGYIQAYKDKISDGLWETRFDKLKHSQPILAEEMLRANSKEIKDPKLLDKLQAQLRESSLGVRGVMAADRAITEATQDTAKVGIKSLEPGSRDRQLKELDAAIEKRPNDPDLREARYAVEQYGTELNTSGLPNSKDIRALLPIALGKVEKMADEIYGKDKANPDRAAFVKRTTSEIVSKVSLNVQQMEAIHQQQYGKLINFVSGIQTDGAPGGATAGAVRVGGTSAAGLQKVTSLSQIQANPEMWSAYQMVDYRAKIAIDHMIEKNQKAGDKGDPAYARDLLKRIWAEPGTQGKIDYPSQIYTPENIDRLSSSELNHLAAQAKTATTAGGRSAQQMQAHSEREVQNYFSTHYLVKANAMLSVPSMMMRWNEAAGKKIDEYIKDPTKDVRTLFMQDTKDSVVSGEYLKTFITSTPAQGLSDAAAAAKAKAPAAPPPVQPKTQAEYDALPPGTPYLDSTGKRILQKGGVKQPSAGPAQSTRQPEAVLSSATAAPGAITYDAATNSLTGPSAVTGRVETMDATGKLVQPPPVQAVTVTPQPASEDEAMPKRSTKERPLSPGHKAAMSGESLAARRQATDAVAAQRRDEIRQIVRDAGEAFSKLMQGVVTLPVAAGRYLGQAVPDEIERMRSTYRDIIKPNGRGFSEADYELIQTVKKLGDSFFTPLELKKADYMLGKLKSGK